MITAPLEVGATHVKATEPFPDTPTTDVGTDGAAAGMTAVEAMDEAEVPIALVAVTANV